MRMILTIAAAAAVMATAATATPMRHHAKADNGSAAVRALNEKSLQEASASGAMTSGQPGAMSDAGTQAPANGAMAPMSAPANTPDASAPDAAPAPTAPQ